MERNDLDQRIDILQIFENQIVFLENRELSNSLAKFKTDNIQWVLNHVHDLLAEMQEVLDMEELSQTWN